MKLSTLLENCDRQPKLPTDQPTDVRTNRIIRNFIFKIGYVCMSVNSELIAVVSISFITLLKFDFDSKREKKALQY